jgi:pyrroloquinoline quinone (PQQ) biosynthesis protein C
MPTPTSDALSPQPTSISSSRRLPRAAGEQRELTPPEQRILQEVLECCERRFDHSVFFRRLALGDVTPAALKYMFGQYGHFRLQLQRWFAACIILIKDASQPAQREAILALADHIFTDLRDGHDLLFAELLHDLGFPVGTLHAEVVSPATAAYIESFLDDCRAPGVTWFEAMAALGGRELSVVVRNQRLLKSYFAPRGLRGPTWITLHAELEIDHFLDLVRPVLMQGADAAPPEAVRLAIERTLGRHVEYLDALLQEHEDAARAPSEKRR